MKQLSFILLSFFLSATARAEGLSLQSEVDEQKSFVAVSIENAQFALPGGTITGLGGKIEYTRFISPKFSIDPYFSMAFGSTGGVSSTFTGFGAYVNYALLGECCAANRSVKVEGRALISEVTKETNTLRIGAGFDQVFLNGEKAVYPSSGLGIAASYDFGLFSRRFRVAVRSSFMTANQTQIQALFLSGGIVFPF
jgi:hypothetical protein